MISMKVHRWGGHNLALRVLMNVCSDMNSGVARDTQKGKGREMQTGRGQEEDLAWSAMRAGCADNHSRALHDSV